MSWVLLVLVVGGGDCRNVVRQQVVQQVVDYNYAPVYQPLAITYPAFVYAAGDTQRLQKLETIAEQNAQILANQQQLMQALTANGSSVGQAVGPVISQSQQTAQKISNTSCLSCHSGPSPKGKLDFTDLGKLSTAQKLLVTTVTEDESMPPKPKPPLSDADFQALRKYMIEDRQAVKAYLKQK